MLLQTQGDGKSISLEGIERTLVENAVSISNGNYSAAARLLGITRSQLAYRCEKYKLEGEA
ncbi:helix-turn-helix domain-containing protein [Aromatoleum anaerobium]|uniref:helix-turn-helix domain-containing protein n=1 Tax=Aromatoleum anaerobium TaxID=182180 RepID=UPI001FF5C559|nr:helix-turn-helix domain-containing protein [Aromatoleum anaerobium]MCK0506143.1 helix-turn-helix domain-containing protein [Aromatoleum anaerobium]